MSENLNLKELPHQFLLRKYSVNPEVLSTDGKQMIKDLEKTIRLVASKSKDGNVKLTPATQQKISTYDRYICDSIFEYLDDQDKITEAQADKVEEQMDDKREEVEDKMEDMHQEEVEQIEQATAQAEAEATEKEIKETTPTQEETEPIVEATDESSQADGEEEQPKNDDKVNIGFWEWE
jgi:alpha-galactosidase/6-phospho-beta-glucosidase family protein